MLVLFPLLDFRFGCSPLRWCYAERWPNPRSAPCAFDARCRLGVHLTNQDLGVAVVTLAKARVLAGRRDCERALVITAVDRAKCPHVLPRYARADQLSLVDNDAVSRHLLTSSPVPRAGRD